MTFCKHSKTIEIVEIFHNCKSFSAVVNEFQTVMPGKHPDVAYFDDILNFQIGVPGSK